MNDKRLNGETESVDGSGPTLCYAGDNPVLRYFAIVRPQVWEAPDHEKVAFLMHHGFAEGITKWDVVTDALAELIPEQREFWLRVQATWNAQFLAGMTAMFEKPDLTDDEATIIGAAIAVKDGKDKPA